MKFSHDKHLKILRQSGQKLVVNYSSTLCQWNWKYLSGPSLRLRHWLLRAPWHGFCLLNEESCSYLSFNTGTSKIHLKEISRTLHKEFWRFGKRKFTAWKVSVARVFLVRIFPHSDWMRRERSIFPAFGLNAGRCGVSLRIQSKCGKMRTRKTPNTDTFHVVDFL